MIETETRSYWLTPNMSDKAKEWLDQRDITELTFSLTNRERDMPRINNLLTVSDAYRMASKLSKVWGDMVVIAIDKNGRETHLIGKDERASVKQHPSIVRSGKHLDVGLAYELMERDTGRWVWEELTASFSGKDEDLDTHYTGVSVGSIVFSPDENKWALQCVAHWAATFPPPYMAFEALTDQEYDQMMDVMAEAIEPIAGGECEWSGDDWFASGTVSFTVDLTNPQDMAQAIELKTWHKLRPVSEQIQEIRNAHDSILNDWINYSENKAIKS